MSFWDSLNDVVNEAFGHSQGQGWGPDTRTGLDPMSAPGARPFARDPAEIQSIAQANDTPFRVIDINCYEIDGTNFPCVYSRDILSKLIGPEYAQGTGLGGNAQNTIGEQRQNPYWRTIPIPFSGNFLKVEFLPLRINQAQATSGKDRITSAVDLSWDTTNLFNQGYWDTPGGNVFDNASFPQMLQMKNIILIGFDAQNQVPIIAEHGTIFKCPFNTAFISFKTGSSRIRITVGYDTEIHTPPPDKAAHGMLHMHGKGLLEKPLLHYEPFSITATDNDETVIGTSIAASGTLEVILVDSFNATNAFLSDIEIKGVGLLWITTIQYSVLNIAIANNVIGRYTIFISDTSGNLRRIVSRHNIVNVAYVANGPASYQVVISLPTPIRVSLHQNEQLRMRIKNFDAGAANNFNYSILGYTYGNWRFSKNTTTSGKQVPIALETYLSEHPYFLDNFRTVADNDDANYVVK